jgi:hypothetical protein
MPKFPEDPFAIVTLEGAISRHGLDHLRVRRHGDLLVVESGSTRDPVHHLRLRRATRQWYTLEIANHNGQWQPVPIRARSEQIFETVLREFPWVLTPVG